MKALFITSIGDPEQRTVGTIAMKDVPIPEPKPEEVRIKIAYASICGSDPHILRGDLGPMRQHIMSCLPMRTGHEISGVIDAVGVAAAAHGFKVGEMCIRDRSSTQKRLIASQIRGTSLSCTERKRLIGSVRSSM